MWTRKNWKVILRSNLQFLPIVFMFFLSVFALHFGTFVIYVLKRKWDYQFEREYIFNCDLLLAWRRKWNIYICITNKYNIYLIVRSIIIHQSNFCIRSLNFADDMNFFLGSSWKGFKNISFLKFECLLGIFSNVDYLWKYKYLLGWP